MAARWSDRLRLQLLDVARHAATFKLEHRVRSRRRTASRRSSASSSGRFARSSSMPRDSLDVARRALASMVRLARPRKSILSRPILSSAFCRTGSSPSCRSCRRVWSGTWCDQRLAGDRRRRRRGSRRGARRPRRLRAVSIRRLTAGRPRRAPSAPWLCSSDLSIVMPTGIVRDQLGDALDLVERVARAPGRHRGWPPAPAAARR